MLESLSPRHEQVGTSKEVDPHGKWKWMEKFHKHQYNYTEAVGQHEGDTRPFPRALPSSRGPPSLHQLNPTGAEGRSEVLLTGAGRWLLLRLRRGGRGRRRVHRGRQAGSAGQVLRLAAGGRRTEPLDDGGALLHARIPGLFLAH